MQYSAEVDATIVADSIARQIEGRVSYRRAIKMAIATAMRVGAEGIKVQVSGRLGGYVGTLGPDQSAQTALNMRYLVAALYLFSAVMQLVGNAFIYNLDQKTLAKMTAELEERHAK